MINLVDWLEVCDDANSTFTCFQYSDLPFCCMSAFLQCSFWQLKSLHTLVHKTTRTHSNPHKSFSFVNHLFPALLICDETILLLLLFYAQHRSDFVLNKIAFLFSSLSILWNGNRQGGFLERMLVPRKSLGLSSLKTCLIL